MCVCIVYNAEEMGSGFTFTSIEVQVGECGSAGGMLRNPSGVSLEQAT